MSKPKEVLENSLTRALAREQRSNFIAEMSAHFLYLLASKINTKYFEVVAYRRPILTLVLPWHALLIRVGVPQRLAVVCRGGLSALLVQRLIYCGRGCDVKRALKHATCVMSRRHFVGLKDRIPKCVSTLRGHSDSVSSVAFHPSAPYLATCSDDKTAKLWLLNADCTAATCVFTLPGHRMWVRSVAFHPSAPYLATVSLDKTIKLWLLNADCSAATCVATMRGQSGFALSVAFHPSGEHLATGTSGGYHVTGSHDNTAKLWGAS